MTCAPLTRGALLREVWQMVRRYLVSILTVCLVLSLAANVWMLLENRRLLSQWSPEPSERLLQVHVLGAVQQPGVYSLPAGSRVADALSSAGGTLADAVLGQLNLAKPLFDGEQVVVQTAAAPAAGATELPSASGPQLLDINSASVAELELLPYIGPAKAQAIVDYRQQNGAFASIEQLLQVPGIGEATLSKFRHLVAVK
jgi:competence protein ComEA